MKTIEDLCKEYNVDYEIIADIFKAGYAAGAKAMTRWIPIEEGLPEDGRRVLCITNTGLFSLGYVHKNHWYKDIIKFEEAGYTVTHWMPLPSPPPIDQSEQINRIV